MAPGEVGARWGLGDVLVGIVLFFLVQMVVAGVVVALLPLAGITLGEDGTSGLVLLGIAAPLGWAVMVGWPMWLSRTKGSGSMARDFGLAIRATDLLVGLAGGLLALGVSVGLGLTYLTLTGEDSPTNTDMLVGNLRSPLVLVYLFVIVAVGTPIAEEVFFRGLVLGAARKRWGTPVAVAFSSLLFGAFHVQQELGAWLFVGVVTAGYGAVFALTRVWTQGRLGAAVVAHMIVNAVVLIVVSVSS